MLATIQHNPNVFTQGLELTDQALIETGGRYGQSRVRKLDPKSGELLTEVEFPSEQFAEGLTFVPNGQLITLTWQERVAQFRDGATLEVLRQVPYNKDGWGACFDESSRRVVTSDGTATLTFRDPKTLGTIGEVEVTDGQESVDQINELECVNGQVWANLFQTDRIVRIDLSSGKVTAIVDASNLVAAERAAGLTDDEGAVLNGIAYQPATETYLVTGKLWSNIYEVKFEKG